MEARTVTDESPQSVFTKYVREKDIRSPLSDDEVASSLLLQMAVYFNICFTPFWVISHILTFNLKYDALNEIYQIVLSVVFFIIFLVEGPRLYLGYAGNLSESVPSLTSFWLLTLLIQFPLVSFISFHDDLMLLPLEKSVNAIMLIFIALEVIVGYFALRTIARHQAVRFQMHIHGIQKTGIKILSSADD
ncbi:transmembrane protein 17B-like [Centruroides sculpturatus]|uniref:transmembrane protein 17B-like n=1 Tax=Centruroides sculpturatus TaxID=218467 RepID=UPI000C6D25A8|nr:transmembrane protein 17B-like [Centruroides sculpturatus]